MDDRDDVIAKVNGQVGAIFRNTLRGPGACQVCIGPAVTALCSKCGWHRHTYGPRLANLVVPLSYAVKGHQSGHHMYGYKGTLASSAENRRDMKLVMFGAMCLHRHCISAAVGEPWSAVTFVSSRTRPGVTHPIVEVAQQVTVWDEAADRLLLDLGPSIAGARGEGPLPDRFALADQWRSAVRGRHVVVVDDTWVTGTKAQSAAITLKDAGASAVTILCVARWLDRDYDGHGELIDGLPAIYDVRPCPVAGAGCLREDERAPRCRPRLPRPLHSVARQA